MIGKNDSGKLKYEKMSTKLTYDQVNEFRHLCTALKTGRSEAEAKSGPQFCASLLAATANMSQSRSSPQQRC